MQHDQPVERTRRRVGRWGVWGLFVLFLSATLGVSVLLQRMVSPFGDAVVAAAHEHDRQLSGVLIATEAGASRYAIYDGVSTHPVKTSESLNRLAGRRVTATGMLDPKTGLFEVANIRASD